MIDREDDASFQRNSATVISHRVSSHATAVMNAHTSNNIPSTTTKNSHTPSTIMPSQQAHHQHPLYNSYGSNSKLGHSPQQPSPQKSPHRRTTTTTTSQYKYLQVIMMFISVATIINVYTSSYILKQRLLIYSTTSTTVDESIPIQSYFFPDQHQKDPTSFLKLLSSSSANTTPQPWQSPKRPLPSEHHSSEWELPLSTIEDVIVQSDDYHTTQERRLVVCAANQEYVDFADNFVHQLLHQRITNFVIVPLDQVTYEILHPVYPHHTLPTFPTSIIPLTQQHNDNHLNKEVSRSDTNYSFEFGSVAFRQLTASRPNFLRQILQQVPNVTIFYNDIDMVWKSNAWQVLDERLQIAQSTPIDILEQEEVETAKVRRNTNVDELMLPPMVSKKKTTGRKRVSRETVSPIVTTLLWHDGPGLICTCMLYLKPTVNNIQLLIDWEQEILHDTEGRYLSDQDAFIAYIERTGLIPFSQQMTTYAVHPVQTNVNVSSSTTARMVRKQEASAPSYMTVLFRNDHEFPHGHKYNWYNTTVERHKNTTATSKKDFFYHPKYAVIVHNNWIKGKAAKWRRFQLSGLWNPSGLL